MNEHRKELIRQYKSALPEAGVYRILNTRTNKSLLGSTPNLASIRNKLEFVRTTGMTGALDLRLSEDIRQYGIEAFSLEILEVLETKPETTEAQVVEDLAALLALWREKLAGTPQY